MGLQMTDSRITGWLFSVASRSALRSDQFEEQNIMFIYVQMGLWWHHSYVKYPEVH